MEKAFVLFLIGLTGLVCAGLLYCIIRVLKVKYAPACVNDMVIITGGYNPDTGWVYDMKGTQFQHGRIIEIDRKGKLYLIALENGDEWYYNREDFIIL